MHVVQGEDLACGKHYQEIVGESTTAFAGTWLNFRNDPQSLRFQSARILKDAEKKLVEIEKPSELCFSPCVLPRRPQIILFSLPQKFHTNYEESQKCAAKLEATKKKPLLYSGKVFSDMEKLGEWFSEFSMGKGKDGKDLYRKCDGSCSPQYKLIVTAREKGYQLDAEVLCGHARDKDDNSYLLSQRFLWRCKDPTP